MASPAACAQYSSLLAAVRVSTAPRRRPASSFSRVHIPPAARTAPRSLSVSLSVLRPCAHRGASDRGSAGNDAGFGFSPCDPAVEDPYDVAATTTDLSAGADADDGLVLHRPFVEDPFEPVATMDPGEGADDQADADLVLRVPFLEDPFEPVATTGLGEGANDEADADLVLRMPFVEDPFERVATMGLGKGAGDPADADLVLRVPFAEDPFERVAIMGLGKGADDKANADLVLRVPIVEEPHEVTALVLHVSSDKDSPDLTATTDLCVVPRDDAGLVLHVPTVEEPPEVAATTGPGDGADDVDDDCIKYPSRLTNKDLKEFETMDFSRSAINARFQLNSKEAKAAVTRAVVGVLSPLPELVQDVRSLDSVFDAEEFQIGMPFAAIMTCMGIYQLWKLSPSTCIDVALYYAFYKLSVIAADVRRRGFAPDWIIRIKLGIITAVCCRAYANKSIVPLDFIRVAIFMIYGFSVAWDVIGFKKYASSFVSILLHLLKDPEGTTSLLNECDDGGSCEIRQKDSGPSAHQESPSGEKESKPSDHDET